jgi:hypothetical protein
MAHYLSLLDRERTANLELRLEIARKDECMMRALEWARKAQEAQRHVVGPYVRKIAALKAENGVLAGICGVPPMGVGDEGGSESSGEDGP